MSLSIIQQPQQPYNPWREQLAASILMPLISDAIQGQRERDANRKQNALREEALKVIQGAAAPQDGSILSGLPEPEGYNSDGWSQALHKQDNPMAQFDANLMPPSPQQRTPNIQDIRKAYLDLAATPRFGMLSPETVDNLMKGAIETAEAQRKIDAQSRFASEYGNAQDWDGRIDALMRGNIEGAVSDNALNMGLGQARYDNPYYQASTINTGPQQQVISVNPRTGETIIGPAFSNGLTPQQEQAGRQWQDTFGYTQMKDARDFAANREDAARTYQLQSQPKLSNVTALEDGRRIGIFSDGTERELTPDNAGFSSVEKAQLGHLETRRKELNEQYVALTKALGEATTDQQRASILEDMKRAKTDMAAIDTKIRGMYESKYTDRGRAQAGDLGTAMLENANAGRVSKNGYFGHDRKTHAHAGTDYPAEEGSPIKVHSDMGSGLTVIDVNTNPNASTYGNYVVLEGVKNGQKVRYRMAHMKTGSITMKTGDRVQAGDVIGGVGSTGRSTGPHLHLEVSVNGQRIDPETFSQVFASPAYQPGKDIPPVAQTKEAPAHEPSPAQEATSTGGLTAAQQYIAQHPESNLSPTYQNVNLPQALTSPQAVQSEQLQTAQQPAAQKGALLPPSPDSSVAEQMRYYAGQPMPEMTDDMELSASRRPALRNPAAPTASYINGENRTSYEALKGTIDGAASRHGVDNELIQAIIETESSWRPNASSSAGAMGLMQLMPSTARSLGVSNAYDPAQNIEGGSKYIAQLIRRYGGDVSKALMAYNCGPGNVAKGRIPSASRQYAQKVMGIYNRLKGQSARPSPVQPKTAPDGGNISWLDSRGQPVMTNGGQPFTDEMYSGLVNAVNAGEYRDVGLNSQADLDRWLESRNIHRTRPAEEQGLSRLNTGRNNAADVYDASIAPLPQTPQNNPDRYPAPYFTDEINATRPQDTQAMLDALNGITSGDSSGWSTAFHRLYGAPISLGR